MGSYWPSIWRNSDQQEEKSDDKTHFINELPVNACEMKDSDEQSSEDCNKSRWRYRSGKFKNGAVGLHNFGVTCCINSVLQTFYRTEEFAYILERFQHPGTDAEKEANIPHQLRKLFDKMQGSEKPAVEPHEFVSCLKKNGIRVNIQHDAEEVFLRILNFLRTQMQDQCLAKEIINLYTIGVHEYQQCLKCSHELKNESYMYTLPLAILNCQKVEQAISQFFELQTLSGRNKYLCKHCNIDTDKKQGFLLTSLPPILNLHLKRYSIDRRWFQTLKISSTFEFNEHLDLGKVLSTDKLSACPEKQDELQYDLFAVVAHSGRSAFYGHYFAYIKIPTENKWYLFNDSYVKEASWKEVKSTFGGSYFYDTAYMLLYRKCPTSASGSGS